MAKRYYWLKLYKDFFTSKRIKKLRTIAGGDTYTIIYLKMQLKALDTDGYLYFDGVMNDFADELALDIDENVDDVKVTINYLSSVGLLETNAEGTDYKLSYMDNLIGSETATTQRVREHRKRKALQCNTNETEVKRIGNVEIEKEKEIEKDIDIKPKTKRFVKPTVDEIKEYCKKNNYNIDSERFYDYYESKGWVVGKSSMKDWKAAVRTWCRNKQPDFTVKEAGTNDIEVIRKKMGL